MTIINNLNDYSVYIKPINTEAYASTPSSVKKSIQSGYNKLLPLYSLVTMNGTFIKDPSQANQIVSEGQSFWMIISADLARIDPANAKRYQTDFNNIFAGTKYMMHLAKSAGNPGEFAAWKVKLVGNNVVLDNDSWGPTANSAADADLDLIRALIYAHALAKQGVWNDHNYQKEALKYISAARNTIFAKENGVIIMKPSEDWDSFHFTDYFDPSTCLEIAAFLQNNSGSVDDITFWSKAAKDSILIYQRIFEDTGTFPAHVKITAKNQNNISVKSENNTSMFYDGIRAPWKIGRFIINQSENPEQYIFAKNAVAYGKSCNYAHTYSHTMDASMYLPLLIATGNIDEAQKLYTKIITNPLSPTKYFENSLSLLGLLDSFYPRKIDLNSLK